MEDVDEFPDGGGAGAARLRLDLMPLIAADGGGGATKLLDLMPGVAELGGTGDKDGDGEDDDGGGGAARRVTMR